MRFVISHVRNPADSLSRQSTSDTPIRKGSVYNTNEAYVQQLRVPTDASDQDIQEALAKIFKTEQSEYAKKQSGSFLKMTTTTYTQNDLFDQDQSKIEDPEKNDQAAL